MGKEFEKWNKDNETYIPLLDKTIKSERKKAWKAALEWTKKQSENLCPEIPESAIGYIIDEELEQ